MAAPDNSIVSTAMVGIKEDVSDIIFNVDPYDTPLLSRSAKVSAHNTLHEWLTEALRASAENAHVEGDDTIADARTAQTRLNNQCQIFKNAVSVSGTDEGLKKYGRASEMKREILKSMKEHKLDIEKALFANNAKVARTSSVAGELGGLPTYLVTNVNYTGTLSAGTGADTYTDGSQAAFSQDKMDDVLQSIWTESTGNGKLTCYLNPFQMTKALDFVGNNNQRNTSGTGRVENDIIVYITPWGQVKWQMSRECRARDVFVLKDDMIKVAQLRTTRNEPLAKTGDSERRQIVTELTLEVCNEKSCGAVFDATTS